MTKFILNCTILNKLRINENGVFTGHIYHISYSSLFLDDRRQKIIKAIQYLFGQCLYTQMLNQKRNTILMSSKDYCSYRINIHLSRNKLINKMQLTKSEQWKLLFWFTFEQTIVIVSCWRASKIIIHHHFEWQSAMSRETINFFSFFFIIYYFTILSLLLSNLNSFRFFFCNKSSEYNNNSKIPNDAFVNHILNFHK